MPLAQVTDLMKKRTGRSPARAEELLVRIKNLLANREDRKAFLITNENMDGHQAPDISQEDQTWLESFETALKKQIPDTGYAIAKMASDIKMSESSLTRQLKRLTGLTPSRYFQELRLNEARQLFEIRNFKTIAEVAYQVGFADATAFNRAFKKRFGKSPSELIND